MTSRGQALKLDSNQSVVLYFIVYKKMPSAFDGILHMQFPFHVKHAGIRDLVSASLSLLPHYPSKSDWFLKNDGSQRILFLLIVDWGGLILG